LNSRYLAIAILIGLIIVAGAIYASREPGLGRTVTTAPTTAASSVGTTSTNSTQQLRNAYAAHLQNIASEDIPALEAEYEKNATLEFVGTVVPPFPEGHPIDGLPGISSVYEDVLSPSTGFSTVNMANESYAVNLSGDGRVTVNSNFTLYGTTGFADISGPGTGAYVANVGSQVSYTRVGDGWFISSEMWDFHAFATCETMSNPQCSALLRSPK
jgi:hypothetical protein